MNRWIALGIVAFLLLSLLRTRGVGTDGETPAAAPGEETRDAAPAAIAPPAAAPARLRIDVQAEIPRGRTPPPLGVRIRAREGSVRPFDVVAWEQHPARRFTLEIPLPVADPDLPLRGELVGEDWCVPPGHATFELRRLAGEWPLGLALARVVELRVQDERGTPLPGARLVLNDGRELGVTDGSGGARLRRPTRR